MRTIKFLFIGIFAFCFQVNGQAPQNISFYLSNKQISKTAIDYYNGKFRATDDDKTLSILDSLKTKNELTRPFYIYLTSRMINQSDGALSEALGEACSELLEYHPDFAIDFLFSGSKMVQKRFISDWAKIIAGDFMITCEEKVKQCVRKALQQSLGKTKLANKQKLKQLYIQIENYCH